MRHLLLTAVCAVLMTACSIETVPPQGPEGSWWVGGADGGVFVNITDDNNLSDNIYSGIIYYDSDQSVWYNGNFKLVGDLVFSPEDHSLYVGWDGERLLLTESSYLQALGPINEL